MLVQLRKGLLVPHGTPGGSHENLWVCTPEFSGDDRTESQPGESVMTIQPYGPVRLKVLVRGNERLVCRKQAGGTTVCPTHLVSAGDGMLISEMRFLSAEPAALPIADLTTECDQLVEVMSVYR
jgi:hypothetical protein